MERRLISPSPALNDQDEVVLDVTHGFRSLPILTLLAAAYLRTIRSVKVEHVLYGAYDARDPARNRSPVFDLTPFLTLLDWLTAADIFIKTGDARDLASLLKTAHDMPWKTTPGKAEDLPRRLKPVANTLEGLSHALAVMRPDEIAEQAAALASKVEDAAGEAAAWAKPFASVLQRVRREYEPLASNSLATQRDLVRWYVKHGRIIQAVLLAREWLVSLACVYLRCDSMTQRHAVEEEINRLARMKRPPERARTAPKAPPAALASLGITDRLVEAWNRVDDLRNDLAHCGMREDPRLSRGILGEAGQLPDILETLALKPGPPD